jgi:shikimate 5-dehydrogenase
LRENSVIYDTVYEPIDTTLIVIALAQGLTIIRGTSVILNQALMAAKLFNKSVPPPGIVEAEISRFFASHAA